MSKRKANSMQSRMTRSCAAILRSNHLAIVNIDPAHRQLMVNWQNLKRIPRGRQMAAAICDYAYIWTIHIAGIHLDQWGNKYTKAVEFTTNHPCKAESLEGVIDQHYRSLLATCNRQQLVGSGWIALPYSIELSEQKAAEIFESVGAWDQAEVAA